MDKPVYASTGELQAAIDDAETDPHLLAAAALFELPVAYVTVREQAWGKVLNMAALLGLEPEQVAENYRLPLQLTRDMWARYCRVVLAG